LGNTHGVTTLRLRGYHPLRHRFPTDFDLNDDF
jgi:hypothetical protein